jgi:hypothetical protein
VARRSIIGHLKTGDAADDTILVAVPERVFACQGRERVFYRTRDGDSLADIAAVFDVTPDNIVEWNNIDPDAKLQPKLISSFLCVRASTERASCCSIQRACSWPRAAARSDTVCARPWPPHRSVSDELRQGQACADEAWSHRGFPPDKPPGSAACGPGI